ncbi:hypothetical protein SFC88_02545 [Nocardioides sp. HM23]|uniref:hypothetical protein n=1 Tax=Nocardioides bizhenqiangii TaxID=3095076 RepID=UPI002ACA1AF0|nr:hypothetical protein [Nocardioides sp. HM23]MDZ5619685.1 hypothetical protein [Nocardioides sp. HM23]
MTDTRYLTALRVAFLVAVAVFAWYGLHGRLDEVGAALRATSALGVAGAFVLVLLGLLATGFVWLRLMRVAGADLPLRDGLATFFVGQLGKYIPGSVWSIGAQAQMAGRNSVPRRSTVAAGLLFLGYHVATGVAASSVVVLVGGLAVPWPPGVTVLLLATSVLGLLPVVVRRAGSRVAGRQVAVDLGDTLLLLALMAAAWSAYSVALVLLSPGRPWVDMAAFGGAFALAYASGVVIVAAPAGFGAREALFVVLLTPLLGVPGATALALLARVAHTAADGTMAAGWWYGAQATRRRRGSGRPATAPR